MNHIMEILPRLQLQIKKLEEIKKKIIEETGIGYTSQDARMVALDSIQISISVIGMWISAYNSLANRCINEGKFDENKFLKSVRSGLLNISQTEEVMFTHLRLGFMTSVHFKIDNLFYNLLRHLNVLPKKTGYWNLTDKILEICSIPKKGREKDILTAYANIRNSLHGNGIHRKDTLKIVIDGVNFDLIQNQRIECAGWEHIVILLDANINILKKILLSNTLLNIKTEVVDDFASNI